LKRTGLKLAAISPVFFFCLTVHATVRAGCLEMEGEPEMEVERSQSGLVTVNWTIAVSNGCDVPYDGTMRVVFHLEDLSLPQETVDFVILQARQSKTVNGTVNLPVEDLSQVTGTEVKISERERPL